MTFFFSRSLQLEQCIISRVLFGVMRNSLAYKTVKSCFSRLNKFMNKERSGMCKTKLACHLLGDLFPLAEFIFSPNLNHLVLISLFLISIRFSLLFNKFG